MDLVPLRVTILLKPDGTCDYPSFNDIPAKDRDNMDWAYFIDKYGGWHYDQVSGHADDNPAQGSPKGTWLGMLLVPAAFATEAVARFPSRCTTMNEAQAESMYENRCHIKDQAVKLDRTALQAIKNKRDLGIAEDQDDIDALNPSHPAPGRRTNVRKTWAGYKTVEDITIV